jgi:putative FmdB family regulatory protein
MTYEYVCTACGHEWEAQQPISAPPLKDCPECSAESARRQISGGAGFILKGGGWYADGYASKSSGKSSDAKPAPTTTSSTPSADSKSSSKSEKAAA